MFITLWPHQHPCTCTIILCMLLNIPIILSSWLLYYLIKLLILAMLVRPITAFICVGGSCLRVVFLYCIFLYWECPRTLFVLLLLDALFGDHRRTRLVIFDATIDYQLYQSISDDRRWRGTWYVIRHGQRFWHLGTSRRRWWWWSPGHHHHIRCTIIHACRSNTEYAGIRD